MSNANPALHPLSLETEALSAKISPYLTSRADIAELRNFFTVESSSKLSERDHHWYHGCSFPMGYI